MRRVAGMDGTQVPMLPTCDGMADVKINLLVT